VHDQSGSGYNPEPGDEANEGYSPIDSTDKIRGLNVVKQGKHSELLIGRVHWDGF